MGNMKIELDVPDDFADRAEVKPFALLRERIRPALETKRGALDAMYANGLGRPEIDPVFLAAFTLLQIMERLPDRAALSACRYDVRWRWALGIVGPWSGFHPTTLVYYRKRLAAHGLARVALEVGLAAMSRGGYLKGRRALRVDSTHMLGLLASRSRLECVRETLRLALDFLCFFGGPEAWEPWRTRYAERHPQDLRHASVEHLRTTLNQAGLDAQAVLKRADTLGAAVAEAEPVALLRRVFAEQFEASDDGLAVQRESVPPGAVKTPHDPQAAWSTKTALGKTGWTGYKVQVCETAAETPRARGEPTEAVITAVLTQTATASDHGSLQPLLAAHAANTQASPAEVFADAGYLSAPALRVAQTHGYELTGPIGAPPHSGSRFGSDAFAVDIPARRATCPAGIASTHCARIAERSRPIVSFYFAWPEAACAACRLRDQCLSKRKLTAFRTLQVGEDHMAVQERRLLCKTSDYQMRMRRRNGIEGSHSELKRGGLRRCRYRGLAKTDVQAQFTAAACNLRRWAARLCWVARKNN